MVAHGEVLERQQILLSAFLGSTALWFSYLGINQVVIPIHSPFDFASALRKNYELALIVPITSLVLGVLLEPSIGRRLYTKFLGRLPNVRRKVLFGSYTMVAVFLLISQFIKPPLVVKILTMIGIGGILTMSLLIYAPMVSSSLKRWEATGLLLAALCVGILIIVAISLIDIIRIGSMNLLVIIFTILAFIFLYHLPQIRDVYEKPFTLGEFRLFEVFLWLGIQVFLLGMLDARTEILQMKITDLFASSFTIKATILLFFKVLFIMAFGLASPYLLSIFDRRYVFPFLYLITGAFWLTFEYARDQTPPLIFLLLSATIWALTIELALYTQSYLGSENSALSGVIIMIFWSGPPLGAYFSVEFGVNAALLTQILLLISVIPLTSLLVTLPKETDATRAMKYLFSAEKLKQKKRKK
ncbi:MAG: hypothetical protein ACFFCW_09905 [Candidatus Hodarchaeota archaeon]